MKKNKNLLLKPHWLTELGPQEGDHPHWPACDFPPPVKHTVSYLVGMVFDKHFEKK